MRISDWSSDVCSSDLGFMEGVKSMDDMEIKADALEGAFDAVLAAEAVDELKASVTALQRQVERQAVAAARLPHDGGKDRKSVGEGKRVSVRVGTGARRSLTKRRENKIRHDLL